MTALITRQNSPLADVAKIIRLISTEFTLKSKKIHGNKVLPFLTPTSHELDTIEDLEKMISINEKKFLKVFY